MYLVVDDRGRQYRIQDGKRLLVDRLSAEVGSQVTLPVMLVADGGLVRTGAPHVEGASVTCKVLAHVRGAKGIAAMWHRRKNNRRRIGFRHDHTALQVVSIQA